MAAPVFIASTVLPIMFYFANISICLNLLNASISFFFNHSQTLTSAPSETRVEMEPAPTWWEASSARARRASSPVP